MQGVAGVIGYGTVVRMYMGGAAHTVIRRGLVYYGYICPYSTYVSHHAMPIHG